MMKQSAKYKREIQKQDRHEGGVFFKAKQDLISLIHDEKAYQKQKGQVDEYQEIQNMIFSQDLSLIEQNTIWKPLFAEEFLNHIDRFDTMNSLVYAFMISNGYFTHQFDEVEVSLIEGNYPYRFLEQYFSFHIKSMKVIIIFRVGLHKTPIIENQNFQGFDVLHRITFIDIISSRDSARIRTVCSKFYDRIQNDPYYMDIPEIFIENQFMRNKNVFGFQDMFLFQKSRQTSSWLELQFNKNPNVQQRWMPNNIIVLDEDLEYEYSYGQYIQSDWINSLEKNKEQKQIKKNNFNIAQQFLNQESQAQIYEFLKRNSKFRAKLTHQEANVLKQVGNTVVIGRSGTGKTTCAILRLLIQQIVFKYQLDLNRFDAQIFINRFDQEKRIRLHGIYVTENSILAKEVKRQYSQLIIDSKDFMNNSKSNQILCEYILKIRQIRQEQQNQQVQNTPKSLSKYNDDQFPLFLDVFGLLLHLDSELDESYFRKFVDIHQANQQHQNNNNEKEIYIDLRKGSNTFVRLNIHEIDYQIFKNIFWPSLKLKGKQNKDQVISQVWTEIIQNIKGSKDSYMYHGYCIPFEIYIRKKSNRHYTEEQMRFIYETFEEYENWKTKMIQKVNYFDRLDYVNHLLSQVQNQKLSFNPIHFTMIDEVQDLPDAVIKLLYKLTEIEVYCSGDTAQNITKGIGFKFSKLNNILCELDLFGDKPNKEDLNRHHLTKNFRSNNQILQLANNIIKIMEALFPDTIDRLKSEEAERQGQKPSILNSILNRDLKELTRQCEVRPQDNQVQYNGGFLRVILVRDEQSLKQAEELEIPNSICLTVYSVKGLEYDEVILYNFFKTSTLNHEQIKILKQLQWNNGMATLNQADYKSYDHIDLCQELKLIYVAITRAKHSFIIFDEDQENQIIWQQIWSQYNLIEYINKIEKFAQDRDKYINKSNQQDQEDYNQRWRNQGELLYAQQNYKQAKKCFDIISDKTMSLQCEAYYQAQEAQILQESQITNNQEYVRTLFQSAATMFEQLKLHRQAGQCFYQAEKFTEALQIYLKNNYFTEAASCAVQINQFQLAAILYHKENFYEKAIRCFDTIQDYYYIIIILINKPEFLKNLDEKYLTYIPQFLNKIFDNYVAKVVNANYSEFQQRIVQLQIPKNTFQEEWNIIINIKYPQNPDELYKLSKHVLGQAQINISKKIISYMIGSQLETIDLKNSNDIRQFCDILDYFEAYNLSNCIRQHNNIKKVDTREYYMTTLFNSYKMSKMSININKNQQLLDQNKRQLEYFTDNNKNFTHAFGMIYIFLGRELFNQIVKQEYLTNLYQVTPIQNQNIKEIYSKLKDSLWYSNKDSFKVVIQFIIYQLQNNGQQIENVESDIFLCIVQFISLINHLFMFNVRVQQQLTLCNALEDVFQFKILINKEFQIISPQYSLINQNSQLFPIIIQKYDHKIQHKKEDNIYIVQTKFILKALKEYFSGFTIQYIQKYISTKKYDNLIHIPIQIYLYLLSFGMKVQQISIPQIVNIPNNKDQFKTVNILEMDDFLKCGSCIEKDKLGQTLMYNFRYNLFLEKQLIKLFKKQLQQPYFYFQTNHQKEIKMVATKKSLHLIFQAFYPYKPVKSIEKLLQAIQISFLTQDPDLSNTIFNNIQLLNQTYNLPIRDSLIEYIYNYKESQLCLSNKQIDFSYLYYYLNQQDNNQFKFNQRRDFLVSFILILIWIKLLIKFEDQQQIFETEVQIKVNQEFITSFEYMDSEFRQQQNIGIVRIKAGLQYNKDEMWQIIQDWFKFYIRNINELGKLYLMILSENIYQNKKFYNKISNLINELGLHEWQAQKLQELFEKEQENLQDITFVISKVEVTKEIEEFKPIFFYNHQRPFISSLMSVYNHILVKNKVPEHLFLQACLYEKGDKFENAIYRPIFQSCHNTLSITREYYILIYRKLIIYICNHSDNNISFKSCFQQLLIIKDFYDQLFNDYNYFAKEEDKSKLNKLQQQVNEVSKVISEWEAKQIQYFQANIKIDKDHKEDKENQKKMKKLYHINKNLQNQK